MNGAVLERITEATGAESRIANPYGTLAALFNPRTVAVVGATDRPASVGATVLRNLLNNASGRNIFAVNPTRSCAAGIACYPSITSIKDEIDLAVIVTPADSVPDTLAQCVEKGVKSVVVISAGFRERGPVGVALEEKMQKQLLNGKLRLIGPNCLGIMNPLTGLNATFAASRALPGKVAFLSQSGAICTAILDWSLQERVGFSAFVSTGSMLDVGWADLIRYFGEDPNTESILLYVESISDGEAFVAAAREVSTKKPIIAIKAGRSEAAAKAATSHTGAMAGNDEILDAAFRDSGILRVERVADLFSMAEVLSKQPLPTGPRLAIVSNAGGLGVLATDMLMESGGELASLSKDSIEKLNTFLPPYWSHGNPVDILGDADAQRYSRCLEVVAGDPHIDGLLALLAPQGMTEPADCAEMLVPFAHSTGKPVLACWMGGEGVRFARETLNQAGIPTFQYPDAAARAFSYMWEFKKRQSAVESKNSLPATRPIVTPAAKEKAAAVIGKAQRQGRTLLTEAESKEILSAYGISVTETKVARSADEAEKIADRMRYPVVLKLYSETLTHKGDVGGVRLNLKDGNAVKTAFTDIQDAVSTNVGMSHFQGVTVQPMVRLKGYELILGSSSDPQFGPVILFGFGGQLTEVFNDKSLALPPLTEASALEMIDRTRIAKALKGVRGRLPVDVHALAAVMVRFSHMITELNIQECDINPLFVMQEKILALDARMVIKGLQ